MRPWTPALTERPTRERRPPVGAIIAVRREPWRVLAIDEVHPSNWTDEERDYWQRIGMPSTWERAPFRIRVEPVNGGRPHGVRVSPQHLVTFDVLPEHYAVCVTCGELAPCRHVTAEREAIETMRRQTEQDARLLPGCCPGCGEPVTSRQESVTFAGENLLSPLAHPDPTFHLRRECRSAAARYEEQWVRADSSRARSLLTLSCAGSLTVHHDGTADCRGAVDSDCPDWRARHRSISACYTLSHGCPLDCPREGHPGAAPGGRKKRRSARQ